MSSSTNEECHNIFKSICDNISFIPFLKIVCSYTNSNERKRLWICTCESVKGQMDHYMHWPHWVWLSICSAWVYSLKNSSSPCYSMSDVFITSLYLLHFKGGFGHTPKSHPNLEHIFLLQTHAIVSTQFIISKCKGLSLFWKDGTKRSVQHISAVWFWEIKWKIQSNFI